MKRGAPPPVGHYQWCQPQAHRRWGGEVPKKHGPWRLWWADGVPRSEGNYARGRPHGSFTAYDKSGITVLQGRYHQGRRVGHWSGRQRDGRSWEGQYLGRREGCWYDRGSDGLLRMIRRYRRGLAHGEWTANWEDSGQRAQFRQHWREGELHGTFERWNREGTMIERGRYRRGLKHGRWWAWSGKEVLLRTGEYLRGKRHGRWQFWHNGGRYGAHGTYRRGLKDGRWSWFHAEKRITGRYLRNRRVGLWSAWSHAGRLISRRRIVPGMNIAPWHRDPCYIKLGHHHDGCRFGPVDMHDFTFTPNCCAWGQLPETGRPLPGG